MITLYGSGDITLYVGHYIVAFTGLEGGITLDCAAEVAFWGMASMSRSMSGDYPMLLSGLNEISWIGDVQRLEIIPKWRCV